MKRIISTLFLFAIFSWILHANRDLVKTVSRMVRHWDAHATTKRDMYSIAKAVRAYYGQYQALPVRNFQSVISKKLPGRSKAGDKVLRDSWGTHFRLSPSEYGFNVVSAGPDRQWGTGDDLKQYEAMTDTGFFTSETKRSATGRRRPTGN